MQDTSFGLSENPTTGILQNNNFFNSGTQIQAQVTLFNWFAKQSTNEANRLTYEADIQQIEKIKNDIALNVAVAYLQILLAREQVNLFQIQVAADKSTIREYSKAGGCGKVAGIECSTIGSAVGYRQLIINYC